MRLKWSIRSHILLPIATDTECRPVDQEVFVEPLESPPFIGLSGLTF